MVTTDVIENYVHNLVKHIISFWNESKEDSDAADEDPDVINDSTKFSISIDVSEYAPEELRVHINGRELIIEGNQEKPCAVGYIQRSLTRRYTLPDDADLDAVETCFTESGRLLIETKKTGLHTLKREVPIKIPSKNTTRPSEIVVIN